MNEIELIESEINDKIQATYHHKITHRTREEFLTELKNNSKSIVLD